jgi:3',5'-cyclic-nucleotide phosphodiesterase/cAMP-specific phosphodiesterase 4
MSRHFEILGKFRTRVNTLSNMDIGVFEDKCQILGMGLKCADIGHSAKDYELHEMWSMLVCEEFFHQGDLEKQRGQSVSMYCDRQNTDVSKSQAGFIKNICLPLYEAWCFYLQSGTVDNFALSQLRKNLEFWKEKKKRRATVKSDERKNRIEILKRMQSTK